MELAIRRKYKYCLFKKFFLNFENHYIWYKIQISAKK